MKNRKRTEYIIHFSIICFKDKGVFHNKQKFWNKFKKLSSNIYVQDHKR